MVSAPRQFAARFLGASGQGGDFVEHRLERDPEFSTLAPVDRRLAQELILGVWRWRTTLDWLIAQKTDGRPQKPMLQTLLRLGLYQLFWLDRIPDHAIVHENVAQARELGFGPQSGFVNALLRSYVRERDRTRERLAELQRVDPATGWSCPRWLLDRWARQLEAEGLIQLCRWNNTPPPTFARVNTLQMSGRELAELWLEEGVEFVERTFAWVDDGLVFELTSHPPLAQLPSFHAGGFYLQDPSTLLAVKRLDPRPGDFTLDLCAAPGGKTTFIAQVMKNSGCIVAHDPAMRRLELVRENCTRLGVTNVEITPNLPPPLPKFDRILVDAPCSNTGVLRRRVELRWRLSSEEVSRLTQTQFELLEQTPPRLKPGGRLVYSTCSLEPEENLGVVERFLAAHPDFVLESNQSLHPVTDGVDGAFVAQLRRRDSAAYSN